MLGAFIGVAATTGFGPATSRLTAGRSSQLSYVAARGIQRLLPLNALPLVTHWWRSDRHGNSPFAWIEFLKSRSFLGFFTPAHARFVRGQLLRHPLADCFARLGLRVIYSANSHVRRLVKTTNTTEYCGHHRRSLVRAGNPDYSPITCLAALGCSGLNLAIAKHSFKRCVARRKRTILEIGTIFEHISHFNRGHFFRRDAKEQCTNCIRQTRSGVVSRCEKFRDLLLFLRRKLNESRQDSHGFSQTRNLSFQEIALLNPLVQVREGFIERFAVFVGGHNL
jgi:hypothetical protein